MLLGLAISGLLGCTACITVWATAAWRDGCATGLHGLIWTDAWRLGCAGLLDCIIGLLSCVTRLRGLTAWTNAWWLGCSGLLACVCMTASLDWLAMSMPLSI